MIARVGEMRYNINFKRGFNSPAKNSTNHFVFFTNKFPFVQLFHVRQMFTGKKKIKVKRITYLYAYQMYDCKDGEQKQQKQ